MQVRLRALEPSDLPLFFAHQCDVAAAEIAGSTIRPRPAFDEHWARIVQDAQSVVCTVEADGEVAGYVSAFPRHDTIEIAFWLGRDHRRLGIGRTALNIFLERFEPRPVYASVLTTNVASLAILERCGFTVVGDEPFRNGVSERTLRLD